MKKHSPFAPIALLLLTVCLSGQVNPYSSGRNFLQSAGFSLAAGSLNPTQSFSPEAPLSHPQSVATVLVSKNHSEKSI